MAGFKFFSIPKPRGFRYKPIYYNEQKEEMREREERIRRELGITENDKSYIPNIKGQFRNAYKRKSTANRQSNIRILIILFILLLISYLLFFR